jgi:hypothetical protein
MKTFLRLLRYSAPISLPVNIPTCLTHAVLGMHTQKDYLQTLYNVVKCELKIPSIDAVEEDFCACCFMFAFFALICSHRSVQPLPVLLGRPSTRGCQGCILFELCSVTCMATTWSHVVKLDT